MAAHQSTPSLHPLFSQILDSWCGQQVALVDRILSRNQLRCCEFDNDEFGCGALGTITHLESERELCAKHYSEVSL
jgi:hypothetical protein